MSRRRRSPHLLLALLFLLSLAGGLSALVRCVPGQSTALLELKNDFSFSPRSTTNLTSWARGTDCCNWEGVSCRDGDSGLVTALDLSNRSIRGKVGSALFNLTDLVHLNLAYNLFGPRPFPSPGFERLGNLTYLNLSNVGFTGQVPAGISRLTKLVSLDLSTFYLDEIPMSSPKLRDPDLRTLIQHLGDLRELYLDGVNISASGTEWCGAVSSSAPGLRKLSLVSCSLSGPINDSLAALRSLSVLRLDENNLNSMVPEFFGNFSSLNQLHLRSCGLKGSFPDSIFKIRNLRLIDVSNNRKLSGFLPEFPEGSSLETLLLPNTKFSGVLPESIGNLKSLTILRLTNCTFAGPIPSSIGKLTKLVQLDLSFNNFNGTIPSALSWEMISEIVLSYNNLTGFIPNYFGDQRLRNLTKLVLRNNMLSGSIPMSLFSLPALQILQLNQNQLSGQLGEFSNASSMLDTLDLSDNKLQGSIPSSIFKLSGLNILSLSSNNFSGTVELDLFRSLWKLASLDLSYNSLWIQDGRINTSLPSPMMGTLNLAACNLTKVPGFLQYQREMNYLDLSNNKITGAIPKWIWNIGNLSLTYLNLSCNLFTDVEGPLPELPVISLNTPIILDLHSNMLQGPILLPPTNTIVLDYSNNNFNSIPSLISMYLNYTIFFSLSNNSLTGEIPPSICNASFIQVLDFSHNNLSGILPACLMENITTLSVLNLRGNQLNGTIPQNFVKGCALRTINLNGNKFEGQVPRTLAYCKMLEVLDVGNNNLIDSFPFWLGNLSDLRVLVLRSNSFYGSVGHPPPGIDASNYTFPMLQIFDLSSNHFNGSLSTECFKNLKAMMNSTNASHRTVGFRYLKFGHSYYQDMVTLTYKGLEITLVKILTIFTSIDFSNNGFDGDIPEVIGGLRSLLMLNMSQNSLSGRIPPSLGDLKQLESLDLSSNNLSGRIPSELTNLTFLSSLNLSNNRLSGKIPLGSQFSTFSASSFERNEGLCGIPLPNKCPGPLPPPESQIPVNYTMAEPCWEFIFVGSGFGTGLAMLFGALMVWGKGRRWFNERVDKMFWAILSPVLWVCNNCKNGRVGSEDEIDEDSEMEEEGGNRPRFCVFCTRLEFCEGRVVAHHTDCACHIDKT